MLTNSINKNVFTMRLITIKDVFDAIVEMITNSDDSYHRLYSRKLRNKDGGQYLLNF